MARKRSRVARIVERGYWSEADARVVVDAWQESGETMALFARRHGVQAKRLARWVRRLQGSAESGKPGFYPVRVVGGRDSVGRERRGGIEVMRRGWRVRVAPGFATEDLQRVLEVLEMRGR